MQVRNSMGLKKLAKMDQPFRPIRKLSIVGAVKQSHDLNFLARYKHPTGKFLDQS